MLERFKLSKIESGLAAPFRGKAPKVAPPPTKPMVSSRGDQMRRETASAIEQGLKHGSWDALARYGLKHAREGLHATQVMPEWQADFMHARHGDMNPPAHPPDPPSLTPPPIDVGGFNAGAAAHVAAGQNASAAAMAPQAHTGKGAPLAPHLPAPPSANIPAAGGPPTPTAPHPTPAPSGGGPASRFKMPGVGGTLGALGLGALAAGAWGMHKQHQRDVGHDRLVHAPLQGVM